MKITKVRDVKTPTRGTNKSAGIDFYVPNDFETVELGWGDAAIIPSGIKVKIPEGYALIAHNKSGVALKGGLQVGACVIDEDYQGEVHIHVTKVRFGQQTTTIEAGAKLVQMILIPVSYADVELVDSVEELYGKEVTERGEGGFGSTGTK